MILQILILLFIFVTVFIFYIASVENIEKRGKLNMEKHYIDMRVMTVMSRTTVPLQSETRIRLNKAKALGEFVSYDELLNYLLDQVSITTRPRGEVKR